jgi:AcrR family transcriptional regulator
MLRDATVASSSILEAGFELFRHYGFKKTTMGEIAKRAGVSRPTLYARYESKEHIFAAVVEHYVGELAREVEERAADVATLHDKLAIAFEVGMVRPHEASRADSFKRELLELDDPRIN